MSFDWHFSFSDLIRDIVKGFYNAWNFTEVLFSETHLRVPFRYEFVTLEANKYLRPTGVMDIWNSKIRAAAGIIRQPTKFRTLEKAILFVRERMTYQIWEDNIINPTPASDILQEGIGDCVRYSVLLTALLRANRIPARTIRGYKKPLGKPSTGHAWVEVYYRGAWRTVDPLYWEFFMNPKTGEPGMDYRALVGERQDYIGEAYHKYDYIEPW